MSITFSTNIPSLVAQNALTKNTANMEKAMNRLSTGLKINSAKDDPAAIVVAERFSMQIVGNNQVLENIQNGVNTLNIAEGSLNSILNDLSRIRDLCVQGANDYYTTDSLNAIKDEIQSRLDNINQLSKGCEFNGIKLLDGSSSRLYIQTGFGSDVSTNAVNIAESFRNCQTSAGGLNINLSAAGIGVPGSTLTATDFANYMNNIDAAMTKINDSISKVGAKYNRLTTTYENTYDIIDNQTEAKSGIMDADIAEEASKYTQYQILQEATASILTQANSLPEMALSLLL